MKDLHDLSEWDLPQQQSRESSPPRPTRKYLFALASAGLIAAVAVGVVQRMVSSDVAVQVSPTAEPASSTATGSAPDSGAGTASPTGSNADIHAAASAFVERWRGQEPQGKTREQWLAETATHRIVSVLAEVDPSSVPQITGELVVESGEPRPVVRVPMHQGDALLSFVRIEGRFVVSSVSRDGRGE